ncbi:MAG: hypothetical protein KC766_14700 [Myxococcales bacterium]|nr:hypothetical protein [Myxococcales bacterium]
MGLGTLPFAACSSGDTCSRCGPGAGGSGPGGSHGNGGSGGGSAGGGGMGSDVSETVRSYCECMLNDCHDDYHRVWGEDHVVAEAECQAEASGIPEHGAPTDSGDFIECRVAACGRAIEDPSACAAALGSGACAAAQ